MGNDEELLEEQETVKRKKVSNSPFQINTLDAEKHAGVIIVRTLL